MRRNLKNARKVKLIRAHLGFWCIQQNHDYDEADVRCVLCRVRLGKSRWYYDLWSPGAPWHDRAAHTGCVHMVKVRYPQMELHRADGPYPHRDGVGNDLDVGPSIHA